MPEQVIFDDLALLAATTGFAHVVAGFCARDNFTWFSDEMRADLQHLYSRKRLIRTEMLTLIGLMAHANPDYDAPLPTDAAELAARGEALLEELHHSMTAPWGEAFREAIDSGEMPDPWRSANAMREPIFYGGEAAFSVQNCDLAAEKYSADGPWLVEYKGASINDMIAAQHEVDGHRVERGERHSPPGLDPADRECVGIDVDGREELIECALHPRRCTAGPSPRTPPLSPLQATRHRRSPPSKSGSLAPAVKLPGSMAAPTR